MATPIKLRQAQVWKVGADYFRIVRLERLVVEYKSTPTHNAKLGIHIRTSKKEFCRLIKSGELLPTAKGSVKGDESDATVDARPD
jgi:hypothetical protein